MSTPTLYLTCTSCLLQIRSGQAEVAGPVARRPATSGLASRSGCLSYNTPLLPGPDSMCALHVFAH